MGYATGIVVNEHTDADNIVVGSTIDGPNQTHARNAWQATVHDLNDPRDLGTGDITYWVVVGNVGAIDQFSNTD